MLSGVFCVRQKKCILSLILVVVGAWLYLVLRIKYPLDAELVTEISSLKVHILQLPDNSVHHGYQTNEIKLLNGKFQHPNSAKTERNILASQKNSAAEDQYKYIHISSTHNNYRNNEAKLLERKSSNANSSNNFKAVAYTSVYPLFQPAEEEEFPTTDGHLTRIPHIIHQMYADEMIPGMYINHVKSFIKYNPTWEYRFWTDVSGRRLLQKHHHYLVDVYDNFGSSVKRSDLLRYAVLYEYGGFYADLDMDNLRSLNITTMKYACIVPVEPFEHSALLNNMDFLMNNAIMICRPRHPFFKLLLWNLRGANPKGDPVTTTGPRYVTRTFIQYNHIRFEDGARNKTDWTSNSPYFYKGELREDDNNSVYVPNTQYFMDKLDPVHVTEGATFTRLCKSIGHLPYRKQRACSEFYKRKDIRENKKYALTVHHWYHLWLMNEPTINELKKINISEVVPNCIPYNT